MIKFLTKATQVLIFLPFYHVVSDESLPYIKHLYPITSQKKFERDLDFLLTHFEPISLEQLYLCSTKKIHSQKPSFFLSFDDGLRQCYDVIAPILLKKGVPATFFINSAFIDNKELMFRYKLGLLVDKGVFRSKKDISHYAHADVDQIDALLVKHHVDYHQFLEQYRPYLSLQETKKLEEKGFTIGAHSHSHPYFGKISLQEQIEQATQSLQFIEQHLNQSVKAFAFPFDDVGVSNAFFQKMRPQVDLFLSAGGIKEDEYSDVYRRVDMEKQESPSNFVKKKYLKHLVKKTLRLRHIHNRPE